MDRTKIYAGVPAIKLYTGANVYRSPRGPAAAACATACMYLLGEIREIVMENRPESRHALLTRETTNINNRNTGLKRG